MLRIGHRGAAGYTPENTLASIEKGIELGVDLIEIDVRRTRDGHLVLLHDERVNRTTNGRGHVADMTLAQVKHLDAGAGQRIPTLEEALEAANGHVGLILELKVGEIGQRACEIVQRGAFKGTVIYASFIASELLPIRDMEPHSATMALLDKLPKDPVAYATNVQATHIGLKWRTATPALVQACHRVGLQLFVYTVNDPKSIRKMQELGVDGIISDFPDRL
jgi:glycerophosphoryl diester phosphodiesterase